MRQIDRLNENFQKFLNEDLQSFVQNVFQAIEIQLKSERLRQKNFFGNEKAFIEPLFNVFSQLFPNDAASIDLETFKKFLLKASQKGLINLTRADLTPAMDQTMVSQSVIPFGRTSFHFVQVPHDLIKKLNLDPLAEDFQQKVQKDHSKKKKILIGLGKNKDKTWKPLKSFKRSKSSPPGFESGDSAGDFVA